MASKIWVTGDDIDQEVQLTKGGSTFTITPGATVRSWVVPNVGSVFGPKAVLEADGGDWSTSLVTLSYTSAESATFDTGRTKVEIEVDDSKKTTWFVYDIVVKADQG